MLKAEVICHMHTYSRSVHCLSSRICYAHSWHCFFRKTFESPPTHPGHSCAGKCLRSQKCSTPSWLCSSCRFRASSTLQLKLVGRAALCAKAFNDATCICSLQQYGILSPRVDRSNPCLCHRVKTLTESVCAAVLEAGVFL